MKNSTAPALGQWANAPLVFVLAQVRFLPQAGVTPENIRDAITKRVANRFGTIQPTNSLDIQINLDGAAQMANTISQNLVGYDMLNTDVDAMIRIFNGSITYATTRYQNSSTFQDEWMDILKCLADVGIPNVNRLGLRYVDFLIPSEGKTPEDYVVAPWDCRHMVKLPGSTGLPDMNVSMMDVPYPQGRMRIQYMRGFGIPNLPADLQGMLPPAKQTNNDIGLCGIIDTDRWLDGQHVTEVDGLRGTFKLMHKDLSGAFQAMTTEWAQQEWKKQ